MYGYLYKLFSSTRNFDSHTVIISLTQHPERKHALYHPEEKYEWYITWMFSNNDNNNSKQENYDMKRQEDKPLSYMPKWKWLMNLIIRLCYSFKHYLHTILVIFFILWLIFRNFRSYTSVFFLLVAHGKLPGNLIMHIHHSL